MSEEIQEQPEVQTEEIKTEETPKTEEPLPKKPERKISRAEKKMRDTLLKHNLKELENVSTVTMRRGTQLVFSFTQPDVFYVDDVYIIFGESSSPDAGKTTANEIKETANEAANEAKAEIKEDEEEVDASGLEENDIKMVMDQATVSRARAVKALRENNNDMVSAVMSLTV